MPLLQLLIDVVPILTSTVIECQRAGFKKRSLEFATQLLMNNEYKEQIDPKFRRKIETLVRKSAGTHIRNDEAHNVDGIATPCPFCGQDLLETELTCHHCRNNIPFCIATGHHIIKEELTVCPNCQFAANLTHLLRLLEVDSMCPMCSQNIDITNVVKVENSSLLETSNE